MSEAIKAFEWRDYFATGLAEVDEQHQRLVTLINGLSSQVASGHRFDADTLGRILDGLGQYAGFHFACEERLMAEAGVDPRHADTHGAAHRNFVLQVEQMQQAVRDDAGAVVPVLLRFVTSWLTFHILDADQTMARQIHAIRAGTAPADAYAAAEGPSDPGNAALLDAVHTLLGVVAARNEALAAMNADLEARVIERTGQLRAAEQRLAEAEKLAALGQLGAGVAHEINNPLAFVGSNLGTLGEYAERLLPLARQHIAAAHIEPDPIADIAEELPGLLTETGTGLARVRDIVAAMRDMAALDPAPRTPTAPGDVLDAALGACRQRFKEHDRLTAEWSALPMLPMSPPRMQRALEALLDNALLAAGPEGRVRLSAGADETTLWIDVADTGPGMTEAVQRRLFEPFFTTRPVGSGRGLGLTLAREVVTEHGGRIEVDSTPSQGSRFRMVLPRP